MKKIKFIFIAVLCLFSISLHAEESLIQWLVDFSRHKGVEPVKNETYNEECGACHFPYPPGFLPARSWKKLLSAKQLEDHFGDSAELDEDIRIKISQYAIDHSADKSWYKRSRKIMASLDDNMTPLRISQTPYIKDKHSEIPKNLINDNPDVNSLSNCDACHRLANDGVFDDDTVLIPGHGRW
ncbi:MAG TPA: cytochrome C [Gammaproteobacteria bacterium]|nr:cytochrome C [Gammaproteobacteria bacterium]